MSGSGATRRDLPSCIIAHPRAPAAAQPDAHHRGPARRWPVPPWLYENTEVLNRRDGPDGHVEFDVRVPRERIWELNRHWRSTAH